MYRELQVYREIFLLRFSCIVLSPVLNLFAELHRNYIATSPFTYNAYSLYTIYIYAAIFIYIYSRIYIYVYVYVIIYICLPM